MKRIAIVGCGGAGKSTLSKTLGNILGIEVIHLDRLNWNPGWVETPREELRNKQEKLVKKDSWIFDGNYGATMDVRLQAADTIVFLDIPRHICFYRVIKRRIIHHNKMRSDMGEGCPEKLDSEFLKYVWNFSKARRPQLLKSLEQFEKEKRVIILKSNKDVELFLELAHQEKKMEGKISTTH
ncbi:DNA topology modulation protein [Pseudalkalibacillus salsuginis]|uniref:DNA topology modulation protein n=1 Tax=Pseudalkalibacillus salsuginis TaxID=2910972 RepID=UPI001F367080|nr:DNA topology modulation protein [Pseudalkalibacillus salsuginis]MCF6409907.1 DNA topology modulation protein [Pseudalkalibacillus salsuginis]